MTFENLIYVPGLFSIFTWLATWVGNLPKKYTIASISDLMVKFFPEISVVGYCVFIVEVVCPLLIIILALYPGSNFILWERWKLILYVIPFFKNFAVLSTCNCDVSNGLISITSESLSIST